jgi:ABC-type phosphate/phosphonate transport system permease subunit
VRASEVLGLLGTGGVWCALDDAIHISRSDCVSTILLPVLVLVPIPEVVVIAPRRRLIRLAPHGFI